MRRPTVFSRLPAQVQDVLLAAFVTIMQIQGTQRAFETSEVAARPLTDFGNLGFVLLAVSGLTLVVRRRWPIAVFAVTAMISLAYFTIGFTDGPGWLALFVAVYTLTAHGDGRRSLRIVAAGIAVLAVGWLAAGADVEPQAALGWVFFRIGATIMAAALGESVRSRRVIAADALQRAERAERTRDEEARRRVDAERLRIAREVHDTVAHAVAIINVQAGVTAHVLDKRPERARETLVTIEQTSAQALHELRAILGVLRGSDDERAPSPGLAQVDDLAAMASEAGLDLKVETSTLPAQLPSAVDGAAYRILQESITNVIRHAGPTRVTVTLACTDDNLRVCVVDDGPASPGRDGGHRGSGRDGYQGGSDRVGDDQAGRPRAGAPHGLGDGGGGGRGGQTVQAGSGGPGGPPGNGGDRLEPGRGIVGMRERCQLLGGELAAGPQPDGGFRVEARLPLSPAGAV